MAGSYRHVTDQDGNFRGMDLIDNLGDAHEAIEEMVDMINWLANRVAGNERVLDTPRLAIFAAWREGYLKPRQPENAAKATFTRFWE